MKIFGREPAQWAMLINVSVMFIFAFIVKVTGTQQGVIMAVVMAILGVIVAAVSHDGLSAAILGFAKAALSLALAFGVNWSPAQQAILLSLVTVYLATWLRTQITAPVPPQT